MHRTQNQKKYYTQENLDKSLDKMLILAAEEKLLPKIIYQYSFQNQSPRIVNEYRQSVKEIYTKQTAKPLRYNEEQAKTHREKFREKILKLINNELPIDYLKNTRINQKYTMTYKDQQLEQVQYPTKPQFSMFNNFTQQKFKYQYNNVFDDKLEYKEPSIFGNPKQQSNKRAKQKFNTHTKQFTPLRLDTLPVEENGEQSAKGRLKPISLPKLVARVQFDKSKLGSAKTTKKKEVRKIKNLNEQPLILETMTKIGKYSNISKSQISITKESIIKYFKDSYLRPHRIIDFLEFSDVQTFNSFSKIPQKLKFMPTEHIYFMAFLFFDYNNDGYICNNDLLRIQEIGRKCPVLMQDHDLIKNGAIKVKFESKIPYLDLYKLPEITETTYFNWLQKSRGSNDNPEQDNNKQLKQYFEQLNKRKIFIHYQGFKKLYQNEKPFIWYDILWRVSGIKYEGLKYE